MAIAKSEKTDASRLYSLQEKILFNNHLKANAQGRLDRQQKIAEIAGTEDLSEKYQAGQAIVAAEERIESVWPKYKSLGGSAASLTAVDHFLRNPCGHAGAP